MLNKLTPYWYCCLLFVGISGCFYPEKGRGEYSHVAKLLQSQAGTVKVLGVSSDKTIDTQVHPLSEDRFKNLRKEVPKMRIGRLPFPFGPFKVIYSDYPKLSKHGYDKAQEKLAGIIYLKDFGFVDLAHIRNTIDLTYMSYKQVRESLENKHSKVVLAGAEPSVFVLDLDYDSTWSQISREVKDKRVDELSVVLGGKLGLVIASWHEVLTSFGYTATLFPEFQSSFSFDDQNSHVLGAYVATRALTLMQSNSLSFDENVTLQLAEVLQEFNASSRADTVNVHNSVRSKWWVKNKILKRHVHIGSQNEEFLSADIYGDGRKLKYWQQIHTAHLKWDLFIYPFTNQEDEILTAVGRTKSPLNFEKDATKLKTHILEVLSAADAR